jgi:hypothetical protein
MSELTIVIGSATPHAVGAMLKFRVTASVSGISHADPLFGLRPVLYRSRSREV